MSERFAQRVVLVTGGATGIGAASARAFAREGARVTVVDVNDADGEATVVEIGGRFRHVDVRDEAPVHRERARLRRRRAGVEADEERLHAYAGRRAIASTSTWSPGAKPAWTVVRTG